MSKIRMPSIVTPEDLKTLLVDDDRRNPGDTAAAFDFMIEQGQLIVISKEVLVLPEVVAVIAENLRECLRLQRLAAGMVA